MGFNLVNCVYLAFVVPRPRGKRYPSFICISRFNVLVVYIKKI